jgi:hypothetical protein
MVSRELPARSKGEWLILVAQRDVNKRSRQTFSCLSILLVARRPQNAADLHPKRFCRGETSSIGTDHFPRPNPTWRNEGLLLLWNPEVETALA